MTWVAAAVAGGSALFGGISANQKSQDAKGTLGQATDIARARYAAGAPYRTAGQNALLGGGTQAPDLSSVYGEGPTYSPINNPLLDQANTAQGTLLNRLTNGPDYLAQAKQAMSDFDTAAQPVLAAQRRIVGQKAATLGRIGSGGVTTDLGNLQSDYERNRLLTANDLIRQATNAAQQDRYATLGAAQGISGQQYGQSAAERQNSQGIAQQGVANRAAQYGAEQGTQGQRYAQGLGLANLGQGYDPTGVLLSAAGTQYGEANQSANDMANAAGVFGNIYGRRRGAGSAGYSPIPADSGLIP